MNPSELYQAWRSGTLRIEGPMAFDTETSGLFPDDGARVATVSIAWVTTQGDPLGVEEEYAPGHVARIRSHAWPFDQGVAGTGKPEDNGQGTLFAEANNLDQGEWEALLLLLEEVGGEQGLEAHNAKFDVGMVRAGVRRWPGRGTDLTDLITWDTQNVNAYLWPLEPTSLKPTCGRLFGQQVQDESKKVKEYLRKNRLPTGRWDLIPWDIIGQYADLDARITRKLGLRQRHDIDRMPARQVALTHIQRRLETTKTLARMERRGLPYDAVGSRLAAQEVARRANGIAAGLPFRATGPAVKDYFFGSGPGQQNLVPYAVTDGGAPSLTAEVVTRMVADGVKWAKEWAEYTKVTNAGSMWFEAYANAVGTDGRLRTCFRQNGTRSSRFSVERVNLQAVPQNYRLSGFEILQGVPTPRQLVAAGVPDGWRLWELDLAQAELRVGAAYAKCDTMLAMITNGEDLHTYTTRALFPQEVDSPEFKDKWRQVGKRANFSLLFGAGGETFRRMIAKETGLQFSEDEATQLVRRWNALYPEFKQAIDRHMSVVEQRQRRTGRGWVVAKNGERRWFLQYEDAHKAFNQRVQLDLAQFGIDWMLETDALLRSEWDVEDGGGGLVLTIHDSQVLLLPEEGGARLAEQCAEIGRELWKERFPEVPGGVDLKQW